MRWPDIRQFSFILGYCHVPTSFVQVAHTSADGLHFDISDGPVIGSAVAA